MKKGVDYIGIAVGAMVFNQKGELFLSKRGKNARNERGYWEVPGGSVEFGEKLENAIKREMKEEYGVDIELIDQFPAVNHLIPHEKQHWAPTTFLARIKSDQAPMILEPEKCEKIGFFPLDSLPSPLSIVTKIDLEYYGKKTHNFKRYFFGKVSDYQKTKGWFFGHFMDEDLLKSDLIEVAWQHISNIEISDIHFHTQSVEINIVLSGWVELTINGEKVKANKGEFWVVYPYTRVGKMKTGAETELIVIKAPSVRDDKFNSH